MDEVHLSNSESIEVLAEFWDKHDVTDFEEALEEVADDIFERESYSS